MQMFVLDDTRTTGDLPIYSSEYEVEVEVDSGLR